LLSSDLGAIVHYSMETAMPRSSKSMSGHLSDRGSEDSKAIATAETKGAKPVAKVTRDDDSDAYLVQLGRRVRQMRAMRGMSRKFLAQASNVSERYVAQLETGLGNVSIILLRRVAAAIGAPIEDLIAEPTVNSTEWALIRSLLADATPEMIEEAKEILSRRHPKAHKADRAIDRIALIGLRGAGKSTLGRLAAEQLGWRFIELSKEIEKEHDFSMTEIMLLYGQDGYRRFEQSTLRKIIETPGPMILATGGSIVSEPVTFDLLLSSFFTIWIKASPAEHMSRVRAQGDLRPMGNDKAAMVELITILSSREPLYARARATLDTSTIQQDESLKQLIALIRSQRT
jgi:XRE family transcriptional regulator, aerobic/anaerobic benzoate catabolism transcriptional regulator